MATPLPPGVDLMDNRGPEINRITAIVSILGTLSVAGRLFSRKIMRVRLDASDYTILLALLLTWGLISVVLWGKLLRYP